MSRSCSGFSLTELMVVIGILAILANVALVSVGRTLVRVRDKARIAILVNLQQAIEQYRLDHSHYPITNCRGATYVGNTEPAWAAFEAQPGDWDYAGVCDSVGGPLTSQTITAALSPYIQGVRDPLRSILPTTEGFTYGSNGYDYKVESFSDDFLVPENMAAIPRSLWDPCNCASLDSDGNCVGSNIGSFCQSQQVIALYTSGAIYW